MPESHPTRQALDGAEWNQARRVPAMLACISRMPVVILADALVDGRSTKSPRDFYLDALRWCIRRFAMDAGPAEGPHWVVVDMPSPPAEMAGREVSERLRGLHESVGTAPFDVYQRLYWEPESFPGGSVARSYRDSGLGPTLVAAYARHSDHLQIADVVAGCIRDFCRHNVGGADEEGNLPPRGYQEQNLEFIKWRIRRGPSGVVSTYGFDVFPPDAITEAIKQRVEGICLLQ